jgi:hypothetical protein
MKKIRELTMVSAICFQHSHWLKCQTLLHIPADCTPGALCLTYDEGGSDCSFTSYAEYLEAESGVGAVCFDNIAISLTTAKGLEFKAIINMNREPNAT